MRLGMDIEQRRIGKTKGLGARLRRSVKEERSHCY